MFDRVFYENEAFLRWQVLKDKLPSAIYKDIVSERQELRIFLAVNSAYEIILFSLNEDMTVRDACFLMKTRYATDFSRIDDADMGRVWDFYECDKFVAEGENNDNVTATYSLGTAWGEGYKKK
jgi:hypothetical protein